MRRSSITTSIIFHVVIFVAATISFSFLKREFDVPPPMIVELAEISKIAQTDQVTKKPDKKKEDPPKEEKPPPAAKNTASDATVPVKETPPKEEKKEAKEPPKPEVVPDKKAPPEKKKPEKKKEEAKPEPVKDFSSVLKNLADPDEKPPVKSEEPELNLDELFKAAQGQNAPLGSKLTMREEDALRAQLERCWNVPFGAKDAENMIVEIFMVINPDRTLRDARVVDQARYNADSFFRAAADSAIRAVRSPLCSPFEVPPDKYDLWRTTTVTFNPKDMF